MARASLSPEVEPTRAAAGGPEPGRPRNPFLPPRLPARRRLPLAVVLVALVVLATVVVTMRIAGSGPTPLTQRDVDQSVQRGLDQARKAQLAAPPEAAVAHRVVAPSLVVVSTTRAGTESGTGAGVVVKADGTILTALHVVDGATRIAVRFADGTEAGASVAEREPASDIAVLAVDRLPQVVVPAVLGGGAQVGDAVFAVGHPLGLSDSLSAGVVSALGRSVRVEGGRSLDHLIQFDAAVNPGSSGGPLLNRDGQVIGIVTGLANPSQQGFFVGIGFAVPIATAGGVAGAPPQ